MKLITYLSEKYPSTPRFGCLTEPQTVIDLQAGKMAMDGQNSPFLENALNFLNGAECARELSEKVTEFVVTQQPPHTIFSLTDVRLLAPVPRPLSIRDCMVFEKHVRQGFQKAFQKRSPRLARFNTWVEKWRGRPLIGVPDVWYERPLYYQGNPATVVGTEADILWPSYTEKLDYELEFGIFIGKAGKDISKPTAHQHIAGYTIFNDFSARDIQTREMQGYLGPAKGKSFDTSNALGPYLVTADEIPDPYNLTLSARVNGEEWSRGHSGDMFFKFDALVAYISQAETLYPGEFIGSGTVGGGCGLELDRWLKPGDVVELEVEKLGILRNRIVKSKTE